MEFLEWAAKNPIPILAIAILGCGVSFNICSCTARGVESDHRFAIEKARMIYEHEERAAKK